MEGMPASSENRCLRSHVSSQNVTKIDRDVINVPLYVTKTVAAHNVTIRRQNLVCRGSGVVQFKSRVEANIPIFTQTV
jgi:hypothetical protein